MVLSLQAQPITSQRDVPNCTPKGPIVRNIDDRYSVHYVGDNLVEFILVDNGSGYVKTLSLPSGVRVNDFEIYQGKLFFCGENTASSVGVVGQFEIFPAFFGGAAIDYAEVWSFYFSGPVNDMISCKRLALYDDGVHVNLLVVGDGEFKPNNILLPYPGSAMLAVYNDGLGTWHAMRDYNKDLRYQYTDIACDGNHVVVAAVDANNEVCLFPCVANYAFVDHSNHVTQNTLYATGQYTEDGDVLLSTSTSPFTAAFMRQNKPQVSFVDFSIAQLIATTPLSVVQSLVSSTTNYVSHSWHLYDLRFSWFWGDIYVVGDVSLPPYDVFGDWVLRRDVTGGLLSFKNMGGVWKSADAIEGYPFFVATGHSYSSIQQCSVVPHVANNTHCFSFFDCSRDAVSAVPSAKEILTTPWESTYNNNSYQPRVKELVIETVCRTAKENESDEK